jgi:hypothetical protein
MSCERGLRRAAIAAILVGSAAISPAALAQAPAGEEQSSASASTEDPKLVFAQATRLYKERRFEQALPLFESLVERTNSPNARLYVGHCLVKLGRNVEAYRAFSRVLGNSTALRDDKYDPTREAARQELYALEQRVAKLVVAPAEVPGLTVEVDDQALAAEWYGAVYALEPGAHRVEGTADGFEPLERSVTIAAGETQTVSLALSRRAADQAQPSAVAPAAATTGTPSRAPLRVAGWVAIGVGATGLAVFTIAGLSAKGVHDDLEADCGSAPCTDAGHRDDASRGKTLQTVANIGLVAGLLGAAGGTAVLLLVEPSPETQASFAPAPGGGVFAYRGKF